MNWLIGRETNMEKDKRNTQQPIPDDLEQALNSKQLAALQIIQSIGWQLKFVRRPLFIEAVPVVHNSKLNQIGILDPDGNIDLQLELNTRINKPEQDPKPSETSPREEKRKGMAPVPDIIETLLNEQQLSALHQIEVFGWKLHFIRRSPFQDSVAGIVSPEGDKVATLERNGRIKLLPEAAVRNEDINKQSQDTQAAASELQLVKKHPG